MLFYYHCRHWHSVYSIHRPIHTNCYCAFTMFFGSVLSKCIHFNFGLLAKFLYAFWLRFLLAVAMQTRRSFYDCSLC